MNDNTTTHPPYRNTLDFVHDAISFIETRCLLRQAETVMECGARELPDTSFCSVDGWDISDVMTRMEYLRESDAHFEADINARLANSPDLSLVQVRDTYSLSDAEFWLLCVMLVEGLDPIIDDFWMVLDPTLNACVEYSIDAALHFVGAPVERYIAFAALGSDLRILGEGLVAPTHCKSTNPMQRLRNGLDLTEKGFKLCMADSIEAVQP